MKQVGREKRERQIKLRMWEELVMALYSEMRSECCVYIFVYGENGSHMTTLKRHKKDIKT